MSKDEKHISHETALTESQRVIYMEGLCDDDDHHMFCMRHVLGSRRIPLAAPLVLIVRMERSTA